jgi:hypothetical protein
MNGGKMERRRGRIDRKWQREDEHKRDLGRNKVR